MAAGPAQNRRFLPPDGRAAPGLVAASHHRPPSLRCHARRRSPSSAARAAGMPPYPAVPGELDQRAPNHDGGRDDSRRCARPRCARSVILGDSALRLRHCTLTDLEITARQRRRGAPLLRQVIPYSMRGASLLGSRSCVCCTTDGLESASAGCVAGPARQLAPGTGWPRPRLPQLGEPLPKPVSRKKVWQESGWYVTGHVRGVQALFSRRSRFASFSRGTRVGSTESLTTSAVMIT